MRYEVKVTSRAVQNILDIHSYINDLENPIAANNILLAIQGRIKLLSFMPRRHHIRGRYYSVRVKKYLVIFRIDGKVVKVIKVVHSSRNFKI